MIGWETPEAEAPALLRHDPTGLSLEPLFYADSTGRLDRARLQGAHLQILEHDPDSGPIRLRLTSGGSRLLLAVTREPWVLRLAWILEEAREWPLRLWLCLALPAVSGQAWRREGAQRFTWSGPRGRGALLSAGSPPPVVSGHADLPDLLAAMTRDGYWDPAAVETASLLVPRWSLELAAEGRLTLRIADAPAPPCDAEPQRVTVLPLPSAVPARDPAGALRTLLGASTLRHPDGSRFLTPARGWMGRKFGGWGLWQADAAIGVALAAAAGAADLAAEQCRALQRLQTPAGALAAVVTGRDAWVDRSHQPVTGLCLALAHAATGDPGLARAARQMLEPALAWRLRHRGLPGRRLLGFGSDGGIGAGLYRGTGFAAANESWQDNHPSHAEAGFDAATGRVPAADPGLNTLMVWELETVARLIQAEDGAAAPRAMALLEAARHLEAEIHALLWDAERQIYAPRRMPLDPAAGEPEGFLASLSPLSLLPLGLPGLPPERRAALLGHLQDPAGFGGWPPCPSLPRRHPAFAEQRYWRGRVWPPHLWLVFLALRRAGAWAEAGALAEGGWSLFRGPWERGGIAAENYHGVTGEGGETPDSDPLYLWSGLLPLMAMSRLAGADPFLGVTLDPLGAPAAAPLAMPGGIRAVHRAEGRLSLGDWLHLSGGGIQDLRLESERLEGMLRPGARLSLTRPALLVDPAAGRLQPVAPGEVLAAGDGIRRILLLLTAG